MSESQLLDDFARTRSDGAFGAIVRLHLNMVLATALRQVGDRGAAEEIAQSVFLLLAQKAGSLRGDTTVGGWLYKATLNLCRERMRSDLRRRRREEAAAEINAIVMSGESTWSAMMPLLDEALLSLQEADRLAVILHFMEEQTFREVGHALGVGEDAARKRVNRVVDELSRWFQKRGVALPAGGITAALGLGSIQAASPALAGSELVKLSKAVNELVAQRYQSGLVDQGDNLATMGLNISHRLREIQDGGNLLGEMTGTFVERNFLRQLDPAKAYPFLKYDIRERLGQLDQEEARIRADSQLIEKWMDSANESEIVNHYDRLKVYGEAAALEWLRKRNPE